MSEPQFPIITSLMSELSELTRLLERQKKELEKKDRDIKHLQADNDDLTRLITEMRTPDDQEDEGSIETYTLIDSTPNVMVKPGRDKIRSISAFDAAKVFSKTLTSALASGVTQVTYRFSDQDGTFYQFSATKTLHGDVNTIFHFHGTLNPT